MAGTLSSGKNFITLPKSSEVFDSAKDSYTKIGYQETVSRKAFPAPMKRSEDSEILNYQPKNETHSPPISEISTLKSEDSETDLRRFSSPASDLNFGESPCPKSVSLIKSSPTLGKCDDMVSSALPTSDTFWPLVTKMDSSCHPSENGKLYEIEDGSFYYDQTRDREESSIGYGFDNSKLVKSEANFEETSCSEDMILSGVGSKTESDLNMQILSQSHPLFSWSDSALDFALESLDGEVHNLELLEDEKVLLASITMGMDTASERENTNPGSEEESLMEGYSKQGQEGDSVHSKRNKSSSSSRRKVKVDWTPELHRRFVQAVEQLGVEKAIPSRILELMNVQCLTRHNIASHLQKYRSHRKHMMAREAETNSWNHRKASSDPSSWPRLRRDGTTITNATSSQSSHPPIQPRPSSYSLIQPQSSISSQSQSQVPYPSPQIPSSQHQIGLPVQGMVPAHHHSQPNLIPSHPSYPPSSNPHPSHAVGMPMYVWGHPTVDHSHNHMWQQSNVATCPPWYSTDGPALWHYPNSSVDPWNTNHQTVQGTPMYSQPLMRIPTAPVLCGAAPLSPHPSPALTPVSSLPLSQPLLPSPAMHPYHVSEPTLTSLSITEPEIQIKVSKSSPSNSSEANLVKRQLEAAINDAMRNPWNLPLGLKSPPVDRVISDLKKQGIVNESIIMAS